MRQLPDRYGNQVRAPLNLVAPLAGKATDMRITDSAGDLTRQACSGAVSPLSTRRGDVDRANFSTRPTATTPGARTSTTATAVLLMLYNVGSKHHESKRKYQTWRTRHADIRALEVDDAALLCHECQQLQVLRRGRHFGLRALAQLRRLSDGYGRVPRPCFDLGSNQKRTWVRTWELPVGNQGGAESQSAKSLGSAEPQWRDTNHYRMGCRPFHASKRPWHANTSGLERCTRINYAAQSSVAGQTQPGPKSGPFKAQSRLSLLGYSLSARPHQRATEVEVRSSREVFKEASKHLIDFYELASPTIATMSEDRNCIDRQGSLIWSVE